MTVPESGGPIGAEDKRSELSLVWGKFPGPSDARAALRVAIDRGAYAEYIEHAKSSLDEEVGGIFGGHFCEDDAGEFVHIKAAIRAPETRKGRGHVTFTHESWNALHEKLDTDHPGLRIVGWYHTHPGFGVEFSEMDRFVQQNFFSAPAQIAMVTDPLGGDEAIGINAPGGLKYLERFWVDGRERVCRIPQDEKAAAGHSQGISKEFERRLEQIEKRVGQTLQTVDEYQASTQRFFVSAIMFVCVAVAAVCAYGIYTAYTAPLRPPESVKFVPIPIQVNGKPVLIGVDLVTWDVPPELNATLIQLEEKRQAEAAAKAKAGQEMQEKYGGASTPATDGAGPKAN